MPTSSRGLRRGLSHLQAVEFLYETSLFPDLEYTFKHGLTYQVAYNSLLQERRCALHARIVEAIERLYADRLAEQVERLAHHAYRGEVWDKALQYLRQAGAKAFDRSANREAVACFEQALAALKQLPESRDVIEQSIDLRFDLRPCLYALGEVRRFADYLREAETLAAALDDQRRLGWVSARMTQSLRMMGDSVRAIEPGQRALAIAAAIDDLPLQIATNFYTAAAYQDLGDHRRAIDLLRRNVASLKGDLIYERFGFFGFVSVLSRADLVRSLVEIGEFAEGITRGEEGVRIAESVDDPASVLDAYYGIGELYLCKGDLHKAITVLERGLELCHIIRFWFPYIAARLGYAYALAGHVAEALPLLERAIEQGVAMGIMAHHSRYVAWLSEAYLLAGRTEDAVKFAGRALDLSRAQKERGFEAWTVRLLGEIHSHRDPPDAEKAEDYYRQAMALAEELGMRPLLAHCHLGLGKLYRRTGDRPKAQEHLTTAAEMFRDMDMRFWLELAEGEVKALG